MMTRVRSWTLTAAACGMAISAQALAGPPASLDHVPSDAAVTWVIPDLQSFMSDAKAFGNAVVPAAERAQMNAGLAFVQTMLDMPGMNAAGSAAAVMYVEENGAPDQPPLVMLLPVSDFAALRESLGMQGSGPVFEANMGGGEFYMKDIGGGFVAAGAMAELVQEFKGASGNVNAHMKRLGRTGESVLEGNDITMIANLEVLAPHIRMASEQMKQQAAGMVMMMAGPNLEQAQAGIDMITGVMDTLAQDGQAGLMGVQLSPAGVSFDTGVQYKDGSGAAKMLAESGNAGSLLEHLPGSNFLFAYALDTGNPLVASAFEKFTAIGGEQPGGVQYAEMAKHASGAAGVMGSVPLMGAGLLSNFVTYTKTDDAPSMVAGLGKAFGELNGQSANGMKYITSFESGAATISGVEVSKFAMNMQPDGTGDAAAGGPAAMLMPMIFGPQGGPSGFIANIDGAVVQTMSQNTPLMEKAIEAARNGGGLGASETYKKVSGQLPDNRVLEFYLSVDQVMNTVGPIGSMMGVLPGFEKLPALPPIGIGTSVGTGGMVNRVHVPNEVLSWMVGFAQSMQQDPFGGGDDGFDPDF